MTSTKIEDEAEIKKNAGIIPLSTVQSRTNDIDELNKTIRDFLNNNNTDRFSTKNINKLKKYKNQVEDNITILKDTNTYISDLINQSPNELSNNIELINNLENLKNTNTYKIPSSKITNIKVWMNDTAIYGMELNYSGGIATKLFGIRNYPGTYKNEYYIADSDFIIRIDYSTNNQDPNAIGNEFLITTVKTNYRIKPRNYNDTKNEIIYNKEFKVNNTVESWNWHKTNAEREGYTLASITSDEDHRKALELIGNNDDEYYLGGKRNYEIIINKWIERLPKDTKIIYKNILNNEKKLGKKKYEEFLEKLYHNLRDRGALIQIPLSGQAGTSTYWEWVDESPWMYNRWAPNEPNDCCRGEPYLHYRNDRMWNDMFPESRMKAIYSKISKSNTIEKNTIKTTDITKQILSFNIINGKITDELISDRYLNNDDLENKLNNIPNMQITLNSNNNKLIEMVKMLGIVSLLIDKVIFSSEDTLIKVNEEIKYIEETNRNAGNVLNQVKSNKENFLNMNDSNIINIIKDSFRKFINLFSYNKEQMKEGNENMGSTGDMVGQLYNYLGNSISTGLEEEIAAFDKMEYEERRNYILELAAQRQNALSDNLMDYIVNDPDDQNSSVEKVYNDLHQKNNDNSRRVEQKIYMSKLYTEYIYILKIIIFTIILMIPIILLNKLELINKDFTIFFILLLVISSTFYVIYRLFILKYRDNINYDKIRQYYDRTATNLIAQGKMERKYVNPTFGLTCIGQQCCSDGMLYDGANNKCVATGQCPPDNRYYPEYSRCGPICSEYQTYNPETNLCIDNEVSTPQPLTCTNEACCLSEGLTFDSTIGQCVSSQAFSNLKNRDRIINDHYLQNDYNLQNMDITDNYYYIGKEGFTTGNIFTGFDKTKKKAMKNQILADTLALSTETTF